MSTERAARLARVRLGAGFGVDRGFDLGRVFGAGRGVLDAHIGAAHAGGPKVSKCATASAGSAATVVTVGTVGTAVAVGTVGAAGTAGTVRATGATGTVRALPGASFKSIWYLNPERPMSQSGRLPT
jgi:hypothetical protein